MEQSVPINSGFEKFIFSFKIIRIRDSQQKEKKKMKERNDDKKKNQIRICLDQLYPIYKIKNSKIINC